MGHFDGKNASLLKFSILSDVDGKDWGSTLCLNHEKNSLKLLAQMHMLNKDNGLVFIFPVSAMVLFFTGGTLVSVLPEDEL